jgi:AcrR family transcriptional regulator
MTNDGVIAEFRPNLRDDARARARARIIQGASAAIAKSGLHATIDEIAEEAGVSRRTVFRHFANHAELLAAAIRESILEVGRSLPKPPRPHEEIAAWLTRAMVTMHEVVHRVVGRAFWDIHNRHTEMAPEVADALSGIVMQRRVFTAGIAQGAWGALGGAGDAPEWVLDAFDLHASGFAAHAFPDHSAQRTGELSGRILLQVLKSAVADQ